MIGLDKIIIERYGHGAAQTVSKIHLVNKFDRIIKSWDGLELPDRDNRIGISRINAGTYTAIKHTSPRLGASLWLQDVEGRSEILIHAGNFAAVLKNGRILKGDIEGCILIGHDLSDINNDGLLDVIQSKDALDELLMMIRGDECLVEIINI